MKVNYKELAIVNVCPCCGHINEISVNKADYFDWDNGMNAQDAFPYLTAEERESLISGICPTCWDTIFSDEEEANPEDDADKYIYNPYTGWYDFVC